MQSFKLLEPTHMRHLGPRLLVCLTCASQAAGLLLLTRGPHFGLAGWVLQVWLLSH